MNPGIVSQAPACYESGIFALVSPKVYVVTHGLGTRNLRATWYYTCLKPNNGYLIGDEIPVPWWLYGTTGAVASFWQNVSQAGLQLSWGAEGGFEIIPKFTDPITGQNTSTSASNWGVRCRAEAILP